MKSYYRIMAGAKSVHLDECLKGNFIGADILPEIDLTSELTENWREFNQKYIPLYLKRYPNKTKVAAGLACGTLWTITKGLAKGDVILVPNGMGQYHIAELDGKYEYRPGATLPHRRSVNWYKGLIERTEMSDSLRNSVGSIGTLAGISKHAEEINRLTSGSEPARLSINDQTIEDASSFALEKHLEDFLVANWKQTELGKHYDIFEDNGELIGQQYRTDTGPIDVLAISKDKTALLVVELKKGRASDSVVGQVQRYMGYVLDELAESHQTVKGVIIAQEEDVRIKRALRVTSNIEFYKYEVSFKLVKS